MWKQCKFRTLILISAAGWLEYFYFLICSYSYSNNNMITAFFVIIATLILLVFNIKKYLVLSFLIEYILIHAKKIKPANITLKHPFIYFLGIVLLILMWIYDGLVLGTVR